MGSFFALMTAAGELSHFPRVDQYNGIPVSFAHGGERRHIGDPNISVVLLQIRDDFGSDFWKELDRDRYRGAWRSGAARINLRSVSEYRW